MEDSLDIRDIMYRQILTYSNTRHLLRINAVCMGLADRSSGLWYLLAEMVLDSFEDIGNSSHYNYKVRKRHGSEIYRFV